MESDHRGHGIVLSDDDRLLLDAALALLAKEGGNKDNCWELRSYLWNAW